MKQIKDLALKEHQGGGYGGVLINHRQSPQEEGACRIASSKFPQLRTKVIQPVGL